MRLLRTYARDPRAGWGFHAARLLLLCTMLASCATGVATTEGSGGDGGTATPTTASEGGGGEGATTTATSDGGGGGGEGGSTTGTTSSSTTSSTTTSMSAPCLAPAVVEGYAAEAESNDLPVLATLLPDGDLGFSSALCPPGDIDVFEIPITTAGASLRVEVTNEAGGCPGGASTYVRVFDANNKLLASDTDGGSGNCSLIAPGDVPSVASLEVGSYFVQVENLSLVKVDSYLLSVSVKEPSCGDGVLQQAAGEQCDDENNTSGDGCTADCFVEAECGDGVTHVVAGEQCDDQNTVPGDGCSPTCQFEALLVTESEPNTQAMPDPLDGYDGAVGAIDPAGDQDWYSFEVTVPGSAVTISTSDGLGDCPFGADTEIKLHGPGPSFPLIASDDDDGAGACSLISPALDMGAQNLAVGTYKVQVADFANNDTIDAYVLLVDVQAPGCGDGLVQVGEECDDHNDLPGDGCSATCQFEGNYTTETEPNTLAAPNSLAGFDGVIASIQPANDQDVFSFEVTEPGSSVVIEVSDGIGSCPGFDSKVTLYNPAGTAIATDDDGGVSPCSKIDPKLVPAAASLSPGTYEVMVQDLSPFITIPQYILTVTVKPPSCGDDLITAGEECDDGGSVSGDGCSDTCLAEPPWEAENNDTLNGANGLWPGFSTWKGSIQRVGDHDWFKLTIQAGQTLTLAVHALDDPASCPFDAKLHVVSAGGTELLEDDDDGVGNCPLLNPALDPQLGSLPAGAYYVWVQHFSDSFAAGPYQLDLTIQ